MRHGVQNMFCTIDFDIFIVLQKIFDGMETELDEFDEVYKLAIFIVNDYLEYSKNFKFFKKEMEEMGFFNDARTEFIEQYCENFEID
jgi:hypothetical protein